MNCSTTPIVVRMYCFFHDETALSRSIENMARFACVIVTYFPDQDAIQNLLRISRLSDLLVIFDNTPLPPDPRFPINPRVIVKSESKNIGLAAALNHGIEIAGRKGFENIFLFDQDSKVTGAYFDSMLAFKERIDRQTNRCALYVPDFFDRNSKTHAKFPQINKYSFRHHHHKNTSGILIARGLIAITSGSLLTYSTYRVVGRLPDDYFIDFIDNAYCLRIASNNLLVAVNFNIVLNHSIGARSTHKVLGVTFKPNNHLPVRRYYIARNGIRTACLYGADFPSFALLLALRLAHETLSIIFFEKGKHQKVKAMLFGCMDGLVGRMGAYTRKAITGE
jgi:rhamnosyltransferase